MPLERIAHQSRHTLEEHYAEVTKETNFGMKRGTAMLSFIRLVNELFPQTLIWGLTSHNRLALLTEDESDSN